MKTMNTTHENNLLVQLLQTAHLSDANGWLATITPDLSLDAIRRRADATHAAVARAGRFRYAHWGVFCLVLALALIGAAVVVPLASLPLAGAGAVMLTSGLILLLLFDPRPALQHVDAFHHFCQETHNQWGVEAAEHMKAVIEPIIEGLKQFPREKMASSASVKGLAEALHQAEARGREVEAQLQDLEVLACQSAHRAEEDYATHMNRLRASSRCWSSRLWSGLVRRPAHRALDARESSLAAKRQVLILQVAQEATLAPMIQAIRTIAGDLQTNTANPLTLLADAALQQLSEYTNQGTRGPFGKIIPGPQEIVLRSREIVQARLPDITRSVATRPEDLPIERAIDEQVAAVLKNNAAIPRRLVDCLEQMNGGLENAISQLTVEAAELAVSKLTPGRVPRCLRTVIVHGGPASVLAKAVERRSEGFTVRGIEHDSEKEMIQINECRFEPGAELVELREASEALNLLSEDMKAVMITAGDDDQMVLAQCRPDQRTDPERGLRLLLRGLAFDCLTRKGNTYQFNGVPAPDGSSNGCLATGFESAIEALQIDAQHADRLQQAIDAQIESRGLEGTCKAIQSALNRSDLVPAAHVVRARGILTEELRQLRRALSATGSA